MKNINKRLKMFIKTFSSFIILVTLFLLITLGVYLYVDEDIYNSIIVTIIIIIGCIIVLSGYIMYSVVRAYNRKKIGKISIAVLNRFIRVIMVLSLQVAELMKIDKDTVRGFFVDINNIMVDRHRVKYSPDKLLLLIPHCLQNSKCEHKITNNPYNCKRCGKCSISDILTIAQEYNINVCIASGGTIARKAVNDTNPDIVIAIACTRDLISGILDIDKIPVIAIENNRPEGPCINTNVDIKKVEEVVREIVC
jgi:hypothetical protein